MLGLIEFCICSLTRNSFIKKEIDMKRKMLLGIVFFLTLMGMMATANATPVLWEANGHYYEIITIENRISWDSARLSAAASSFLGLQGHLATITSSAENIFISNNILLGNGTNDSGIEDKWLGGYQIAGSEEPDSGWAWVTGETFSYNNWAGSEPNNSPEGENAIIFQHGWTQDGKQWNDLTSSWLQSGYIIEYENNGNTPVPEPATIFLLGSGLAGLASMKRKKQNIG
jgi:hypothetical protein